MQINWTYAFNEQFTQDQWRTILAEAQTQVGRLNRSEGDNLDSDGQTKMLGWQTFATKISEGELEEIENIGQKLASDCEVIWLIGIGGSYLGARAVIEALLGKNYNLTATAAGRPQIYFVGTDTDPDYLAQIMELSRGKKLGLVAISKSGTTLEPALALRSGLELLTQQQANLAQRVVMITDAHQGALHELGQEIGANQLVIPRDIGGRFSVMTAVGLLPMVIAGLNIHDYLAGIRQGMANADQENEQNLAAQLAAWRIGGWRQGKQVEYQVTNYQAWEAGLGWVQQLECESEGQQGHGVTVVPSVFPRDLHSFGQLIQQGPTNCFEIVTRVQNKTKLPIADGGEIKINDDLTALSQQGQTWDQINNLVIDGALQAHQAAGVPALILDLPVVTEAELGVYHYILMKATAISGYLMGHNPFIQPGVQFWKTKLQQLLVK